MAGVIETLTNQEAFVPTHIANCEGAVVGDILPDLDAKPRWLDNAS